MKLAQINRAVLPTRACDSRSSRVQFHALQKFTKKADGTWSKVVHTQSNGTTVIDTVGFTYDALGRRVSKAATGQATVKYLYDGLPHECAPLV